MKGGKKDSFIVLSENRCPSCGERMIRDLLCGGDYHNTVAGYQCQQYCNKDCKNNGILRPEIEGKDPNFISNNGKKSIAVKIAKANALGIIETKNIAKTIDTNNKQFFIVEFAKKIQFPLMEIMNYS